MSEYIKQTYGEDKWEEIRRAASVDQPSFSTHQVYPEALIPRLSKKAVQVRKEFNYFAINCNRILDIKSERKRFLRTNGCLFHQFCKSVWI